MQIFCCASNSGAWFAQVIIQHTRTPASVLSISTAANVMLTNTDRLVCNFGNSSHWNWTMTSTDTELKISQGRLPWFITMLLSLLLNAAENSCSPSWKPVPCKSFLQCQEGFLLRRGHKIFWYRRFNSFPFPTYLSILWIWPSRYDIIPCIHGPGGYSPSLSSLGSSSCPGALLLFNHFKITWKCQVTVGSIHWHVHWSWAKQINHWQLVVFVPSKWLHSTATLSTPNIDL